MFNVRNRRVFLRISRNNMQVPHQASCLIAAKPELQSEVSCSETGMLEVKLLEAFHQVKFFAGNGNRIVVKTGSANIEEAALASDTQNTTCNFDALSKVN